MSKLIDIGGNPVESAPTSIISAEIDLQIATARKFPRSVANFRKTAHAHATLTEAIAKQCLFALPRGGKIIEGPSIRFAEILVAAWGNCRVGARVVREEREFIIAQGVFHDLETNAAITMEVQRRITNREGDRYDADMIAVTGNAARSIGMRNAIMQGVPKALWHDIYLSAKKASVGDVKTLASKREEAISVFTPFGVTEAQVLAALGVTGRADVGADQLAILFGWATAIKDEGADPEEIFPDAKSLRKPSTKQAAAAAPKAPEAPKKETKETASSSDNDAAAKASTDAKAGVQAAPSSIAPKEGSELAGDGPSANSAAGGAAANSPATNSNSSGSLTDEAPANATPPETAGAPLSHPLLDDIAQNLLDTRTLADVDGLQGFFVHQIEMAPDDVKKAAIALFEEAQAAHGGAQAPKEPPARKSFYERVIGRIDDAETPTELGAADKRSRESAEWGDLTPSEQNDLTIRVGLRLSQLTAAA